MLLFRIVVHAPDKLILYILNVEVAGQWKCFPVEDIHRTAQSLWSDVENKWPCSLDAVKAGIVIAARM
jgi:hypothetical protein